jgi:hypothetical protein
MTFDTALHLLLIAYAVVGITVFMLGTVFTLRLLIKVVRRMR